MESAYLRTIATIQEFFKINPDEELSAGTRLLLESMQEVWIKKGDDIVTVGNECQDGMYIILDGNATVHSKDGKLINILNEGDFIGELGLINDQKRGATVRAASDVRCANISKTLFEKIATNNPKIYGTFMNMLYTKNTKMVAERQRIQTELATATKIQADCLETDFTEFNKLPNLNIYATMRPAKEVGGDFYDVFMIDDTHMCFLIADVSGKGVPAALFMVMAKIHIKNYASLGLPLSEVVSRANNQLCYKNEAGMFVTAFICVLNIETNDVTFVNAGHNHPFKKHGDGHFEMIGAKRNLVLGLMEGVPYREQHLILEKDEYFFLYTDGVSEALNVEQELLGDDRLEEMLNRHADISNDVEAFTKAMMKEVDDFAGEETQADDITMMYIAR